MKTIKIPGLSKLVALDSAISLASPHFSWYEATKGGARIPENEEVTRSIIRIATALEGVREKFDGRSITVTSWYRPPAINRAVGGAKFSKHIEGHAVDILIDGIDPDEVSATLFQEWSGGVGSSPAFTHLDLGPHRRWNYGG